MPKNGLMLLQARRWPANEALIGRTRLV